MKIIIAHCKKVLGFDLHISKACTAAVNVSVYLPCDELATCPGFTLPPTLSAGIGGRLHGPKQANL